MRTVAALTAVEDQQVLPQAIPDGSLGETGKGRRRGVGQYHRR
ncbi:MAG: hypothetical protein M0003_15055 [Acidithiobacillus sp.]|nr:hypothetical protein [Acidithiobacillus sp.]